MSITDYIITLCVVVVVLVAAWRGGQTNPVGTGRLAKRMDALELKVGEQGARMDGIEKSVLALAEIAAETNTCIQALRLEVAGDRGLTERTWAAVDRLQQFFIQEAFDRRGAK